MPFSGGEGRVDRDILVLVLVLLVFFITTTFGCGYRDRKLEKDLKIKLLEFEEGLKDGKAEYGSFDLRSVFVDEWEKVCLQFPYDSQKDFEYSVGRKVNGFKEHIKHGLKLWVFYIDGTSRWVKFPLLERMRLHSEITTRCAKFNNPYIYAKRNSNVGFVYVFYLIEDGR